MDPQQTGAAYDRLASHWSSANFDRTNGIAAHERAIRFAPGRGPALDVGCGGSGRIVELLLRSGFQAEGVDVSARMLAFAREKHPATPFYHADIARWTLPRAYDFISAWDSIFHLPLMLQRPVLKKLCDGLAPRGVLIFTAGGVDAPEEISGECHGQRLEYSALGIPDLLRAVEESGGVLRHLEFDQHPDNHLYLIVQKRGKPGLEFRQGLGFETP